MGIFLLLQRTAILLLILSVGRIPLPWIHSHDWLCTDSLANHIQAYHVDSCECALPCGLHFHVFTWGGRGAQSDGWNRSLPRGPGDLFDRQERAAIPNLNAETTEQLQDEHRRDACCPVTLLDASDFALASTNNADNLVGPLGMRSSICAQCCVYLI